MGDEGDKTNELIEDEDEQIIISILKEVITKKKNSMNLWKNANKKKRLFYITDKKTLLIKHWSKLVNNNYYKIQTLSNNQ